MSQQLENAGTKELAQKYLRHTLSITKKHFTVACQATRTIKRQGGQG